MNDHQSPLIRLTRIVNGLTLLSALTLTFTGAVRAQAPSAAVYTQIGSKVTVGYQGDALAITVTAEGVQLRCGFQKLEGRATTEGLWLESTAAEGGMFRVTASAISRGQADQRAFNGGTNLPRTGTVNLEQDVIRLIRPSLVEEYSVTADGVRQDFLVTERPEGAGELVVALNVAGATVEAMSLGARLILRSSGRKIAYSGLQATDSKGKELQRA